VLTRGKAAIAAAVLLATGGLAVGAQASGQLTGGVVHVYEYDPPTTVPGRIILTGAISDHGLDRAGAAGPNHTYNKLVLTKGSFELNMGKIKIHQHLDTTSCTLVVQGSGPAPIVKGSGTGAYQGITGTIRANTGFVGVFAKKPDGSCNMNAPVETGFGSVTAVGRLSLG
jgi:archaellin